MMYPHITLNDEAESTHSQILDGNGVEEIKDHLERASEQEIDSARCVLPTYEWGFSDGFSVEEIGFFC